MGLDQNFMRRNANGDDVEIAYFRKVNRLQWYFEDVHNIENCEEVVVSIEDIDAIKSHIDAGTLEHAEGFFYGQTELYTDELTREDEQILEGLADCEQCIKQGDEVYYTCWY